MLCEAVDEIAEWLDQVYDAKRGIEELRRDVREILSRLSKTQEDLGQTGHAEENVTPRA
jgi:hypothetical protein